MHQFYFFNFFDFRNVPLTIQYTKKFCVSEATHGLLVIPVEDICRYFVIHVLILITYFYPACGESMFGGISY
jgi:hypothetical protein